MDKVQTQDSPCGNWSLWIYPGGRREMRATAQGRRMRRQGLAVPTASEALEAISGQAAGKSPTAGDELAEAGYRVEPAEKPYCDPIRHYFDGDVHVGTIWRCTIDRLWWSYCVIPGVYGSGGGCATEAEAVACLARRIRAASAERSRAVREDLAIGGRAEPTLWACACGWRGPIQLMTANASGCRTCPECGGSGGLVTDPAIGPPCDQCGEPMAVGPDYAICSFCGHSVRLEGKGADVG